MRLQRWLFLFHYRGCPWPLRPHACFCSIHFAATGSHGMHGDRPRDPAHFLLDTTCGAAGAAVQSLQFLSPFSQIARQSRWTRLWTSICLVILSSGWLVYLLPLAESFSNSSVCSSKQQTHFMWNMVHPCDRLAMLGWLSRGFPSRTPVTGCSIYIFFSRSSWKKHRLLTKSMQIVICSQHWTLWLGTVFGCPVNMLFSVFFF